MKFFKDKSGQVFGYDNDQIAMGLHKGLKAMTDAEVEAHKNPPPTDDQLAGQARFQRAKLLIEADTLINIAEDAGADTKALRAYRQALRDVPQQKGFPKNITWPAKP